METIQISKTKYADPTKRTWTSIADLRKTFSEAEIVEIVHRWADAQTYRNAVRARRNERIKAALKFMDDHTGTAGDMSGDEREAES